MAESRREQAEQDAMVAADLEEVRRKQIYWENRLKYE